MDFRESIAYNLDLNSGEKSTIIKQKPIGPVRGLATIELFDSCSGKKIYEAKTENVINNVVSRYAYMDYFYSKIKGDRTKCYFSAPFQYVVLTDYEGVEDAALSFFKGGLVGYADKATAYSGSDILKGTINTAETKLDETGDGLLHFVFDFPTHAANGTFQSLWWVGNLSTTPNIKKVIKVECPCTRIDAVTSGGYVGNVMYRSADKWVCIMGKSSVDAYGSIFYPLYAIILNDDFSFYKYIDISGKLSYSLIGTYCGYGASDNGVIIINGYKTANNIAIIDIDTGQVTYLSLDTTNIGGQNVVVNIRGNKLYVSGTKFCEYVINESTITLVRDYGPALPYYFSDFNNKVAFLSTNNNICYISEGTIKNTPITISSTSILRHLVYRTNDDEAGYVLKEIVQDGKNVTLIIGEYSVGTEIGAQTLLASPVTKTPTNTMKIQYDFQIEKVL